jgi:hypothetical protein
MQLIRNVTIIIVYHQQKVIFGRLHVIPSLAVISTIIFYQLNLPEIWHLFFALLVKNQ